MMNIKTFLYSSPYSLPAMKFERFERRTFDCSHHIYLRRRGWSLSPRREPNLEEPPSVSVIVRSLIVAFFLSRALQRLNLKHFALHLANELNTPVPESANCPRTQNFRADTSTLAKYFNDKFQL